MKILIFSFVVFVNSVLAKHEIYKGNEVYKVKLSTEMEVAQFHEYESAQELDVWTHPVAGARDASVMVTPHQKPHLLAFLDRLAVRYELDIPDVAAYLQEQDAEMGRWRSQRAGRLTPFDDYPRYAQVDEYMEGLANRYPDIVSIVNAGQSFEGRDIKYLKISNSGFTDVTKPVIFLDAMIHAREWVTTPVAIYAIHRLVENLAEGEEDLLNNIDWIIMPIVNPDGYEYTHESARLWRKTRSNLHPNAENCPGVDANRNFDIEFNTIGVDANPCTEIYPGMTAFSEPETVIVRDIMHEHLPRIQMYLNMHSFGNYVLYGFGTGEIPENGFAVHHVAAAMGSAMDAMKLSQASFYLVGNSGLVLYGTSGSAQDYGQAIGIPFSYTLELPGYESGFAVSPEFINHINAETWEGIKAASRLSVLYYRARPSNN